MKFLLLAFMVSSIASARCIPENNVRISEFAASGISQTQFNAAVDAVKAAYDPVAKSRGYKLVFKKLWSDSTVNSDTTVTWSQWIVNSYGGLARYPGMTQDAYMLVACHEVGHHLGGAPNFSDSWSWGGGGPAVEGEADYWATLNCMKDLGVPAARINTASLVLARVLADLGGEPSPAPGTPDRSVVRETYEAIHVVSALLYKAVVHLHYPQVG